MKKLLNFLLFIVISIALFTKDAFMRFFFNLAVYFESNYTLHINDAEKMQLANLLNKVEQESRGYGNFQQFANYNPDAGNYSRGIMNYNPDAGNYQNDGILRIGGPVAANWAQDKQASTNLATYRVKIFYTPVAVTPAPVDIRFFAGAYLPTNSTFSGGNEVFTNTGGDTVTIQARSTITNWQTMMNISQHENMCIEFLRIRPKSESQLENPIVALHNSQFSSTSQNEISPDDYISPDQYQLLRADVPLGFNVGLKKGFDWTVDPDQTGTGIGMVMFVSTVLDKDMALKNQPMVRKFGASSSFFTPNAPVGAIENMITQKQLTGNK